MRIGVVLMNLGGPTHEDNVRKFLYNLFKDEDIIKMGGGSCPGLLCQDYLQIQGAERCHRLQSNQWMPERVYR